MTGVRLHGRDEALRVLREALAGAFDGRGGLAVVSGEAGIGKTALATAIAREAEAAGATVTWGRAWEFADAPPYFPVKPCLRELGVEHEQHEAFELWETVVETLARAATTQIWVLEDLHAADLATLDLLTFLAVPLHSMHALVVATSRASDPRLTDRMTQRLTRMSRDGVDVRLEPLRADEIAALTKEIVGRAVPDEALGRLAELTGGNPLFVVECARAFKASRGVGALPPTIRQVVLERVALLPESARQALAFGAILGREFSAASVARMTESLPARVIDTLLPALRAGLVGETRPGQFQFSHTLVRDAIEGALGSEERCAIHGRAELALAVLGETSDVLVERARHALAALRPGDEPRLELLARATAMLEEAGAFDRAFELHARIDEARAAGLLPPATPDRILHVAEVSRAAGHSDARRRLCEAVIASARADRNGELFTRAVLLHCADVRPGVVDRVQVALLEEARALIDDASALGCRLLARLATAMQPTIDQSVPMGLARTALRHARASGHAAVILDVLETGGWGVYHAPIDERIAWSTELLERALAVDDRAKAMTAFTWLASHHTEAGDFAAFERTTSHMLALSDEIGHPRQRWRALLIASARATTSGRFAESDRCVTEVAKLSALIDDPALGLTLAVHDVMRARVQRRDDETRHAIAKLASGMTDAWEGTYVTALLRATAAARMEDAETTRAQLEVLRACTAFEHPDISFAAYLAEAHALAGTDDERRRSRDVLRQTDTRELALGSVGTMYDGTVVRVLGLLDAALGDPVSAEARLREAYELAIARRHAPWVAQLAYELARVMRGCGRSSEARQMIDECVRIARALGMTGLERRASTVPAEPEVAPLLTSVTLEGQVWRVALGGSVVRVKDSRGMRLLARLVERPGEEVHVLALASDDATGIAETSAGEVLDQRARKAYRQRLIDLEEELSEAERDADARRCARLEREREALHAELARAAGLGGRVRRAGSATERARSNVQRRLKDAIARIGEADAKLGRFFEAAVHTGTFCCFRP